MTQAPAPFELIYRFGVARAACCLSRSFHHPALTSFHRWEGGNSRIGPPLVYRPDFVATVRAQTPLGPLYAVDDPARGALVIARRLLEEPHSRKKERSRSAHTSL